MRDWIAKLTPDSWLGRKLLMLTVLAAACTVAFCWGRRQNVDAQTVDKNQLDPFGKFTSPDANRRIVAYLKPNIMITREELGEYLIARFGAERLEFLVNRRIVEMECQKHNISVTDQEVEQRFRADLVALGGKIALTEADFVRNVLKRYGKTLYEWKEDVIRPKLMMEKLVGTQVKVDEKDVTDGFEARFGPKVQCRMIAIEKNNRAVTEIWQEARKGREEFLKAAKNQFIPNLAQSQGEVPPIHKHFGDKLIEETAFSLKENEISAPLKLEDVYVILMCEKHIPADKTKRYEQERYQIHREVSELKIAQQMPKTFAELRQRANPNLVLAGAVSHIARVESMQEGGLRSFNELPSLPNMPVNVPAPTPTNLLAPDGSSPTLLPSTPPAPLNIGIPQLPKIEVPGEKK